MSNIDTNTIDDDTEPEDEPGADDGHVTMGRSDVRSLRAAAKKGKRVDEVERELAFTKAGIDTDSDAGRMFMRGYDGELDKEKVREAAIPFGLVQAEPAPEPTGKGHVLHDDTAGDTKLEPGEDGFTSDRATVASGAPPDRGIELNPKAEAIERGRQVIKDGGRIEEGMATTFADLVRSAHEGDTRVTIDRRSIQATGGE